MSQQGDVPGPRQAGAEVGPEAGPEAGQGVGQGVGPRDALVPAAPAAGAVDEAVMGLLAEHVPLTLLVDLVDAPASEQVLVEEGLPPEEWWDRSDAG